MLEAIQAADSGLVLWLNGQQGSPWLDTMMLVATLLGTAYLAVPLACFALFSVRAKAHIWRAAALMTVVVVVLDVGLKWLVDRKRPPVSVPGVNVLGPMLTSLSFPSGHTVTAFTIVGLLFFVDKTLAWVALPIATLVGVSRVYLGVHFPSDVLAGALLGGVVGFSLTRFFARRLAVDERGDLES